MRVMTDDTVLSKRAGIVLAGCDARRKVTLISLLMTLTVTNDPGGLQKGNLRRRERMSWGRGQLAPSP